MIKLGQYNTLIISRFTDYGAYLIESPAIDDNDDNAISEVLLPGKFITDDMVVGDLIEVFVYTDSEDRPVAVTEKPYAVAGEVAFLQVADVNRIGAFMDWGLSKNLLVPFKEQRARMLRGGLYPVYIYVDDASGRVAASAKLEKFLGNAYPDYTLGQVVDCLILNHNDIGYKVVVENKHIGMIYDNDLHSPLTIGSKIKARVKKVRDDGKIDLTYGDRTDVRIDSLANEIVKALLSIPAGELPLGDKSSPYEIDRMFKCSKKDFKKAVGMLFKQRRVFIDDHYIRLIDTK